MSSVNNPGERHAAHDQIPTRMAESLWGSRHIGKAIRIATILLPLRVALYAAGRARYANHVDRIGHIKTAGCGGAEYSKGSDNNN